MFVLADNTLSPNSLYPEFTVKYEMNNEAYYVAFLITLK